jgi:hypothetical protein
MPFPVRARAYAEATERLHRDYPDDRVATIFYVLVLALLQLAQTADAERPQLVRAHAYLDAVPQPAARLKGKAGCPK